MTLPAPFYVDEFCTIYCGDSRELLPLIDADVMVTDPPYGIEFKGKATKWTKASGGYESSAFEDTVEYVSETVVPIVAEWVADHRRAVVTPGVRNMFRYPVPVDVGAIYYPSGAGSGRWGFVCSQPIFYYGPDPYLAARMGSRPNSISSTEAAEDNGHPCPKPIKLMRWMVQRASLPGQSIIDPFMGSGSTLRAAKDLGRKCIGIEIDPKWCEVAVKRLAQGNLFAEGAV